MKQVPTHAEGIVGIGEPTPESFVRALDFIVRGHYETVQGHAFPTPPVAAAQVEIDTGQLVVEVRLRVPGGENRAGLGLLKKIVGKATHVHLARADFRIIKLHAQHT